ncbi:MAG: transcriptional regulator NrdR [Microthrixaceae bacterium]
MRCPSCGSMENRVVDSRSAEQAQAIRRRRVCDGCGERFTTFERIEEQPLSVVKRDGRIEPFDRLKVEAGIRSACKGRPVDEDDLDALVSDVEEGVRLLGGEVETARIGALALEGLRPLDGVAAVRFASVYKGFENPGDFEAEIRLLEGTTERDEG